jgi:hypothetical protein
MPRAETLLSALGHGRSEAIAYEELREHSQRLSAMSPLHHLHAHHG